MVRAIIYGVFSLLNSFLYAMERFFFFFLKNKLKEFQIIEIVQTSYISERNV